MTNRDLLAGMIGFIIALVISMLLSNATQAQDVKYCKNFQTGEIVVVEINMPCPFPMAEL